MKCRIKSWIFMLPLVLSLLWPGTGGHAAECLDESPTILAGKDPYALVNVRDLTPIEHEAVKGLLISLEGEWQGRAVDIYCSSIKDPAGKEVTDYTARAKVEVDYHGNFYIRVDLYSQQRKTTHQEVLRLYLTQRKLRINNASGYGDVELIIASARAIKFLYRLLLTSDKTKGTSRREIFVSIELNGEELSIWQRIYSQGRLSSQKRWLLSPR